MKQNKNYYINYQDRKSKNCTLKQKKIPYKCREIGFFSFYIENLKTHPSGKGGSFSTLITAFSFIFRGKASVPL